MLEAIMHRAGIRFFACAGLGVLLLIGSPVPAAAATVVVPGDYATIQGAIDSSAADVIQIKDGDYAERLVVGRRVTLEPYPSGSPPNPQSFPSVLGLMTANSYFSLICEGLRFRGGVVLGIGSEVGFQACRFDSGLATPAMYQGGPIGYIRMGNCLVLGGATVNGISVSIRQCAFIGGGLATGGDGAFDVRGNYIAGPAAVGMLVTAWDVDGTISDNLIIGAQDGLVFKKQTGGDHVDICANEVRDCAGTGYRVIGGGGLNASVKFTNNRASRCGGNGVEVSNSACTFHLVGNQVDSVGGNGILLLTQTLNHIGIEVRLNTVNHSAKHGIMYSGEVHDGIALAVSDNRVIGAGADGIRVVAPSLLERNVVGRCAGAGIVVDTARASGAMVVRSNTTYLNAGSGLRLHGSAADSVHHNIAGANAHYGLEWTSAGQPAVGCNDWYANSLGPTLGVSPGATDLQLDPRFCDLAGDSITLSAVSELADAPGCGLIGALGVGCAYPTAVEQEPALLRMGLSVMPQPTQGIVRFAWRELAQPAKLEIYDAAGARHWRSDVAPGQRELRWSGTNQSGRPLPAGVYFVRLVGPSLDEKQRLVLIR